MRSFRGLAVVAPLALGLAVLAPAAAQEEPLPEGASLEFLAFAGAGPLPEDAGQLVLFRMTLAPEASFPLTPEQGVVALTEVESGTLTSTVDVEISVSRADTEPGMEETIAAGETATLEEGDSALYPPGLNGEVSNSETDEVSLLVLEAVSTAMEGEGSGEATPTTSGEIGPGLPQGVRVEFLAAGPTPEFPEGDVVFALSRVTYEPGVRQSGVIQPGAEVSIVESGTFTLEVTDGLPVTIYRQLGAAMAAGEEPAVETIAPGDEVEVEMGDAAYFPEGNVSTASNAGDENASALLGFVVSKGVAG